MKAIILVDHGSTVAEANQMLSAIAKLLQDLLPDILVEVAHMELAEPTIKQAIDSCVQNGVNEIIVHPYMLSPGRHSTQDIPRMAKQAAQKHSNIQLSISEPLGIHPKLAQVVAERCGLLP